MEGNAPTQFAGDLCFTPNYTMQTCLEKTSTELHSCFILRVETKNNFIDSAWSAENAYT